MLITQKSFCLSELLSTCNIFHSFEIIQVIMVSFKLIVKINFHQ